MLRSLQFKNTMCYWSMNFNKTKNVLTDKRNNPK